MNDPNEVISAFLDDEPFDAGRLAEALSEPDGRALFLDCLAVRHLVQPREQRALDSLVHQPRHARWNLLFGAAAVVVALAGGYFVGQRDVATTDVPTASRVIDAPAVWQEVVPGRAQ